MEKNGERTGSLMDEVVHLLRFAVAIELWKSGISQAEIGKRLGIAAGSVNKLVKGIKRPGN